MPRLIVEARGFPLAAVDLLMLAEDAAVPQGAVELVRAARKVSGVAAPPWHAAAGPFEQFLDGALAMSPAQRSSPADALNKLKAVATLPA